MISRLTLQKILHLDQGRFKIDHDRYVNALFAGIFFSECESFLYKFIIKPHNKLSPISISIQWPKRQALNQLKISFHKISIKLPPFEQRIFSSFPNTVQTSKKRNPPQRGWKIVQSSPNHRRHHFPSSSHHLHLFVCPSAAAATTGQTMMSSLETIPAGRHGCSNSSAVSGRHKINKEENLCTELEFPPVFFASQRQVVFHLDDENEGPSTGKVTMPLR